MPSRFTHLQRRIAELETLAGMIVELARGVADGKPLHSELATKGEEWYRGARSILVTNNFSGLVDFDWCYNAYVVIGGKSSRVTWDIGSFIHQPHGYSQISVRSSLPFFVHTMDKARALLKSCVSELESRELPLKTELSFTVSVDEFDTAESLLATSTEEAIIRASGVVARVALERHLLTVAESRGIVIEKNPPTKSKAAASDVLTTLAKHTLITPIQKSGLEHLFKIGNNCAHPKEPVNLGDVRDLIKRGREMTSVIL